MFVYIAEGSTPALHTAWAMQKLDMTDSVYFMPLGILLITTFFMFRIVMSPIMLTHMWVYKESWGSSTSEEVLYWFNLVIVAFFACINYFWFYKLCVILAKVTKKKD